MEGSEANSRAFRRSAYTDIHRHGELHLEQCFGERDGFGLRNPAS